MTHPITQPTTNPEPGEPLFARHSCLRRVGSEGVLLFGGQRALLCQIAHPKIAAGVAEHSNFDVQPLIRLFETLHLIVTVVWGRRDEAEAAVAAIHHRHDDVHGSLEQAAGTLDRGTQYSAHDVRLQRWVWATLVDTADVMFERHVRSYRPGERDAVYQDWLRFATFFGIPERLLPATTADFDDYYAGMLCGDELAVTDLTRSVAANVLEPPLALVPRSAWRLPRDLTAALLPPEIREMYGLNLSRRRRRRVAAFDAAIRTALRVTPRARRRLPVAYLAVRRLQARIS